MIATTVYVTVLHTKNMTVSKISEIFNKHLLETHPDLLDVIPGFRNKSLLCSNMRIYVVDISRVGLILRLAHDIYKEQH